MCSSMCQSESAGEQVKKTLMSALPVLVTPKGKVLVPSWALCLRAVIPQVQPGSCMQGPSVMEMWGSVFIKSVLCAFSHFVCAKCDLH